ncbi:helix-turn-helix domain-containing protein [Roseomonas sp. BN140053]|uniref:helix-turn-helix domain-containing protein n=1 Tax=Roseomonas sp. BN140053 TaxID=3391898 RepID=UPI0039E8F06C
MGAAIRRLRTDRGLSLQELSRSSGVSVGMLSQIERNLANPSLRLLTKIQLALGARASALFDDPQAAFPDPGFVRRKDRRVLCDLGTLTKELLTAEASQNLEMLLLHIPVRGSSGEQPLASPSEKGGLVLQGAVVLTVGGVEAKLSEGDSFVFDGATPHSFRNPGRAAAKVLWIISNLPMQRQL